MIPKIKRKAGHFIFPMSLYLKNKSKNDSTDKILIFIPDEPIQRYLHLLVRVLQRNNESILIKSSYKRMLQMPNPGKNALSLPGVKVCLFSPREVGLCIYTGEKPDILADKYMKLDFDVFSKKDGNELFFPINLHPSFLDDRQLDRLDHYPQGQKRDIGVLFAGGMSKKNYDNDITRDLFHIRTRYSLLEEVKRISTENIYCPESWDEFQKLADLGMLNNKIVIIDSKVCPVPKKKWFDILSRARFFISPPGVLNPFCHNTVEAMACGTIPILEFPSIFRPYLEGAILINRDEDLKKMIHHILFEVSEEDWRLSSKRIYHYYKKHMSIDAWAKELESARKDTSKENLIKICQNRVSTAIYESKTN